MQKSLNSLIPKENRNSNRKKSTKKRKKNSIEKEEKEVQINNENNLEEKNLSVNEPLYFYNDKKYFLLLKRTYYLRELDKTEKFINSEKFNEKKLNLTGDEFRRLVDEFNNLLNLQNLYMSFDDLFKSLQLQDKIIKILKIYITNKIDEK